MATSERKTMLCCWLYSKRHKTNIYHWIALSLYHPVTLSHNWQLIHNKTFVSLTSESNERKIFFKKRLQPSVSILRPFFRSPATTARTERAWVWLGTPAKQFRILSNVKHQLMFLFYFLFIYLLTFKIFFIRALINGLSTILTHDVCCWFMCSPTADKIIIANVILLARHKPQVFPSASTSRSRSRGISITSRTRYFLPQ